MTTKNLSNTPSKQGEILAHTGTMMRTGRALHTEAARINGPHGTGALANPRAPRPSIHPRLFRGGIEMRVFRVGNVIVTHWD